MINLNEVIEDFINPPKKEFLKKFLKSKDQIKKELVNDSKNSQSIKALLETHAWQELLRPHIVDSIKINIATLIRDGLKINEVELKSIISEIRTSLNIIANLRNIVEMGDIAEEKLLKMEDKK